MIDIRALTRSDAVAYASLRRQVAVESSVGLGLTFDEELARPVQEFADQLAYPPPNFFLGAFDGPTLVATAGVARPTSRASAAHKAVLWGVLTAPSHRGRSLARQLSTRVIEHAFANGARRVYLSVYLPNGPAVRLYQSLGFEVTGLEPEVVKLHGVYHDIQHMSLRDVGGV